MSPVPEAHDSGSAVVEFVLVSVLVVALSLAVLQLALALHIRNTLVSAAGEGARFGAAADRDPQDGARHTERLIADSLPSSLPVDVEAGFEDVGGVRTVAVRVTATLPVIGWFGPPRGLSVTGHAMEES